MEIESSESSINISSQKSITNIQNRLRRKRALKDLLFEWWLDFYGNEMLMQLMI